jgi:arylsulfatase
MFEQMVVATQDVPIGTDLILSASFEKDGVDPPPVATGILSLYYGDTKVGEGRIKTQPGGYMIAGEGLAIGRDVGDQVTQDYPGERPFRFTGGTIQRVVVDVSGEPYIDMEREAQGMLMRE